MTSSPSRSFIPCYLNSQNSKPFRAQHTAHANVSTFSQNLCQQGRILPHHYAGKFNQIIRQQNTKASTIMSILKRNGIQATQVGKCSSRTANSILHLIFYWSLQCLAITLDIQASKVLEDIYNFSSISGGFRHSHCVKRFPRIMVL